MCKLESSDARNNVEPIRASSGAGGLLIGQVKQIGQDPGGQYRVLVEAPPITSAGEGIWARFASPYASENAGIFFYPETGDEVVLGFINNDPSLPVVLGSLYSKKRTPPFAPDSQNSDKAIITKDALTISMDDSKRTIVVKTPGGQQITLSDETKTITMADSNHNKITMSGDGIALNSCKDVTILAAENVRIAANSGAATIKSATEISASATSINLSASATLALKGDATAQLTSSACTTIKGAMVMIN